MITKGWAVSEELSARQTHYYWQKDELWRERMKLRNGRPPVKYLNSPKHQYQQILEKS